MNKLPRMALYFTSSTKQMHKAGPSSVESNSQRTYWASRQGRFAHAPPTPALNLRMWRKTVQDGGLNYLSDTPNPLDCIDAFLPSPIGKKLTENRGRKLVGRCSCR
jgi:hypothetical protein